MNEHGYLEDPHAWNVAALSGTGLLDAMDGVTYLVSREGMILALGETAWQRFADANEASWLRPEAVLGSNLFEWMSGADVRHVHERLHQSVVSEGQQKITYEFRCDAPAHERTMRMALTPIIESGVVRAVLYQSVVLAEYNRPAIRLFDRRRRWNPDEPPPTTRVLLCTNCHAVAWPPNALPASRIWIEPHEYFSFGGTPEPAVQHGLCSICHDHLLSLGVEDHGVLLSGN
jgi:hypothetical protein